MPKGRRPWGWSRECWRWWYRRWAGDLGRLALAAHRERILGRIRGGTDFGAEDDLPAAPAETEETADLLAAVRAASNFADGRAARTLYALRRVLEARRAVEPAGRVEGRRDRGQRGFARAPEGPRGGG